MRYDGLKRIDERLARIERILCNLGLEVLDKDVRLTANRPKSPETGASRSSIPPQRPESGIQPEEVWTAAQFREYLEQGGKVK